MPVLLLSTRRMSDYVSMRMYAALLPPRPVLEDLAAVVRSVRGSATALEAVPPELIHLPLGSFGNVGLADRQLLEATLREEVACWAPMELRFRRGSALVHPGDDSVWAELDGDVEQLTAMSTVIPRAVQRLGFLIDRRARHSRVRVGRITEATSLEFLERMLVRLDGYEGPAWTAHDVALLRHRAGEDDGDSTFEVLYELPMLADPVDTVTGGGRHRSDGTRVADDGARADEADCA